MMQHATSSWHSGESTPTQTFTTSSSPQVAFEAERRGWGSDISAEEGVMMMRGAPSKVRKVESPAILKEEQEEQQEVVSGAKDCHLRMLRQSLLEEAFFSGDDDGHGHHPEER